ncbi:hypothetical protein [Streptomonospora arabica]|uniref:Sigma-70 family RNA polymerase sigma factor n=1 Tax=Streptomonospora arabica TaxID=412417 RepID=A0ABV9SK53_9ACTN
MSNSVSSTPFYVLRRSFETLAHTPGGPLLDLSDIAEAPAAALGPGALAAWLPRAGADATDEVWRCLITRARSGESVWSVVAAGLALPGLYGARRRLCGGLADEVADLEAEMLSGLLAQMQSMDLGPGAVCGRLVYAARKAGQRYRYAREQARHHQLPREVARPDAVVSAGARGPVTVLAEAIARGILTRQEAELLARTHLEGRRLAAVAQELGLSYATARRRRKRARAHLVETVTTGKFPA